MNKALILSAGILLAYTTGSNAQSDGGWNTSIYVSGAAGAAVGGTSDFNGTFETLNDPNTNSPVTFNADRDVSAGFNLELSAGMQFGNFRVGLDYHYIKANSETDTVTTSIGITTENDSLSGGIQALMVSGEYEFDTGSGFNPYIGAGLGAANVEDLFDGDLDSSNVGAYKLTGGVAYNMNQNLSLFGEYNYFSTFDYDVTGTENGETVLTGDGTYSAHLFNVGVRYGF